MQITPRVVDLSHHNTISDSLKPAYEFGIRGVVHKATEGTGYKDKTYNARRFLAKEAGMLWGAYHFVRPGNVKKQVDVFLDYAKPDDETLLALDHEDKGFSPEQAKEFLALLKQRTGRAPVIYTGHVIKEQLDGRIDRTLGTYRLWHAQYGTRYTINASWKDVWLWQYTESGKVPGIGGNVDVNSYAGTPEQLKHEWAGNNLAALVS